MPKKSQQAKFDELRANANLLTVPVLNQMADGHNVDPADLMRAVGVDLIGRAYMMDRVRNEGEIDG